MNISKDAEKSFNKILHPVMKKKNNNNSTTSYRRIIPQQNKDQKPTANIIHNGKNFKAFPLRLGTRQGCPFLPRLFIIVPEVLARPLGKEK